MLSRNSENEFMKKWSMIIFTFLYSVNITLPMTINKTIKSILIKLQIDDFCNRDVLTNYLLNYFLLV